MHHRWIQPDTDNISVNGAKKHSLIPMRAPLTRPVDITFKNDRLNFATQFLKLAKKVIWIF